MYCILATFLSLVLLCGVCSAGERIELKDPTDKDSYSLGYQFGEGLKRQGVDINLDNYTAGLRDALGGKEPLLSQEEIRKTVAELRKKVTAAQQKEFKEKAEKNLAEGKAFLEKNKEAEGVKALPSGLQYKVLAEGSGKTPKLTDTVTIRYRGTFINGTEFDSSYQRGQPSTFPVNGVIRGWTEALQLMKEGSKWQLFIPPELAYGNRDMGAKIGPNSTLIFEMELISVNAPSKKRPSGK